MKASKFREMSEQELGNQLKEFKRELFNLRFQMATGQLQNPMAIKECRKNIARVNTILRERELQAAAK
jgi:large subunit ribosomal protein L29